MLLRHNIGGSEGEDEDLPSILALEGLPSILALGGSEDEDEDLPSAATL